MRAALAALALAACTSWKFDDSAPFAQLRGSPPSTSGRQRLQRSANDQLQFVLGSDGITEWLTQYVPATDFGPPGTPPKLVRLADPPDEIDLSPTANTWYIATRAVFEFSYQLDAMNINVLTSHVKMTRPGAPPVSFDFDGGIGSFADSDNEAAIFAGPAPAEGKMGGTGWIVRTDGSFRRSFNVYRSPTALFDIDGERLFTFDDDGVIRARSARDETDTPIGKWSLPAGAQNYTPLVLLWSAKPQLTVCDELGLRTIQFVPASPQVLDGDACLPTRLDVSRHHFVYYAVHLGQPVLRSVPIDGSAPPAHLPHDDHTVLAFDADRIAWTPRQTTVVGVFSPGDVGDGWVDDAQFMERGHFVTFSDDGRHLYFLEHAATGDGVGELRSYEIATGITHVLALNTRQFEELPDGRLMAVTNSWVPKDWNRVVVIDEARRTIDWVADGADGFTIIPGSHEVLVDLVTNSDEITMVRMPIPPVTP